MKKRKLLIALLVPVCLVAAALLAGMIYSFSVPGEYMIPMAEGNYFDYQSGVECSGYSSAFVMRQLGKDIDGPTLYGQLAGKNADGTIAPAKLVVTLRAHGCPADLKNGSLLQLKAAISRGVPVVVFVRTEPGQNVYHYLPIVGYDGEKIYAAESLRNFVNVKGQADYNREIAVRDFEKMWATGIERNNQYLVFEQKAAE